MGHSQAVTARRPHAVFALLGATVTLALLACLTALTLAAGITSATSAPGVQNCARASLSAAPTHARGIGSESSCTRPGSVVSTARFAVSCCVAAKAAPRIAGGAPMLGEGGVKTTRYNPAP
jgi:hypothetical protein